MPSLDSGRRGSPISLARRLTAKRLSPEMILVWTLVRQFLQHLGYAALRRVLKQQKPRNGQRAFADHQIGSCITLIAAVIPDRRPDRLTG